MKAYLIEAKRTPIGRAHAEKGCYRNIRADELLAALFADFAPKLVPPSAIDDVYIGCVGQHLEQGKNIARLASLLAGMPDTVPGVTFNRLCASSLQAFASAATAIHCGQADLIMAGGVEHMHHVPMAAALDYHKGLLGRFEFPFNNMGLTAEKVAEKFGISRGEQDEFALESHRKAVRAQANGDFSAELHPVTLSDGTVVAQDQGPRPTVDLGAFSKLEPAFSKTGTVTAGNSSPLSDGASMTLLASEEACRKYGLKKRAQVVDVAVVGVDPCFMGMGPVPAIQKLLQRTGSSLSDIDLFELNEAFASQSIACVRQLGIPTEKVNPAGGAIALGHPLGCTGTRLVATLLAALERSGGRQGIAAMCIGHGQGMAVLLRREG